MVSERDERAGMSGAERRSIIGAAQRCLADGETGMEPGDCNRAGWHVGDALVPVVERIIDARLAAAIAERDDYAQQLAACPLGLEGHNCCDCPTASEQVAIARAEAAEARVAAVEALADKCAAVPALWTVTRDLRAALTGDLPERDEGRA